MSEPSRLDGIPEEYYDECADPRCGHYRCEHDIRLGKAVYIRPGCEAQAKEFEDVHWPGCANADCPCENFKEGKDERPTETPNGS